MPGYGIPPAEAGRLLPWSWAERILRESQVYWLSSVRPDGRPHVMPIWGVWLDGRFYFSTGAKSRKARNLDANPACTLATEDAHTPVVLEGNARRVTDMALLRRFIESYAAKYSWPMEPTVEGVRDAEGHGGPVYEVRPLTVFGIGEDVTGSITRWRFGR